MIKPVECLHPAPPLPINTLYIGIIWGCNLSKSLHPSCTPRRMTVSVCVGPFNRLRRRAQSFGRTETIAGMVVYPRADGISQQFLRQLIPLRAIATSRKSHVMHCQVHLRLLPCPESGCKVDAKPAPPSIPLYISLLPY